MGALGAYITGLLVLGYAVHVQDDLSNYIKTPVALLVMIFLVPLTIHLLEPETIAEKAILWILGMYIPIAGLFIVPAAFEGFNLTGLEGEITSGMGIFLQGTVLMSIGLVAWQAISIWKRKKK